MALCDIAKVLAEKLDNGGDGPWHSGWGHQMICYGCEIDLATGYHTDDCPWLAMPRIVAALSSAQRLVESGELIIEGEGTRWRHCLSCSGIADAFDLEDGQPFPHKDDCLVSAM